MKKIRQNKSIFIKLRQCLPLGKRQEPTGEEFSAQDSSELGNFHFVVVIFTGVKVYLPLRWIQERKHRAMKNKTHVLYQSLVTWDVHDKKQANHGNLAPGILQIRSSTTSVSSLCLQTWVLPSTYITSSAVCDQWPFFGSAAFNQSQFIDWICK